MNVNVDFLSQLIADASPLLHTSAEANGQFISPNPNLLTTHNNDSGVEFNEPLGNTYNYASYGDFLLRSQLDCYDERLPGNGTFDLKTRASSNIRYNSKSGSLEKNDYQIWRLNGTYESYEHEFRDMIRTGAMLKYLFQARIGQMVFSLPIIVSIPYLVSNICRLRN